MTVSVSRIGGLFQIGHPADFFATERSRKALLWMGLTGVFLLSCAPFLSWSHVLPMTTWQQESWAFAAGILMLAPLLRSQAWRNLRASWAMLIPLSLLTVAGLQWAVSFALAPSVLPLLLIEMLWVIALMQAVITMDRAQLLRAMGWGLIAAGLIGGFLGIVQAARLPALQGRSAFYAADGLAYGFLAQRNLFADVQFMAFLALSFVWPHKKGWPGLLRYAALQLLAVSAALSGSNALLMQIAAAGVLLVFWRRRDVQTARRLFFDGLAFSLTLLAVMIARHASGSGHAPGVSVLMTLWTTAWHTILAHPVLGIGFGNTPTVFYSLAASMPNTPAYAAFHVQGWSNVHNLPLQLMLEAGLPGLVVVILLYGALALGWWRARDRQTIFAASLLTVLLVHNLVEFPLWNLPFLGIAAICLALILPACPIRLPSVASVLPVFVGGLSLLSIGLLLMMNARMSALQTVAQITFNPSQIGTVAFVARTLSESRQWSGITGTLLRPYAVYETQTFSLQIVPQSERKAYLRQVEDTMHLLPIGNIPYSYAQLLAFSGREAEAAAAIEQAARAIPSKAAQWRDLLSSWRGEHAEQARRLSKALP